MAINIVLIEPEIPQNTGNIARTCAATGARLHLVGPMGFCIDDRKLKRAGLDYWYLLDISYYSSLADFYARNDESAAGFYYFTTKALYTYDQPTYKDGDYLVFGKETAGLPEELLKSRRERCVRIPIIEEARSLNLSNAVAVGTFEALRQQSFCNLVQRGQLHTDCWEQSPGKDTP